MFSFLVRDEHRIAIPTAHCVVERENSGALSKAMQTIKAWSGWHPRYVLTGDSSIEQLAVRKTFRGLEAGESEVSHILCLVHENCSGSPFCRVLPFCAESFVAQIPPSRQGCLAEQSTLISHYNLENSVAVRRAPKRASVY